MLKRADIKSCYIGPEISEEQFIPEHFFIYIAKGNVQAYDGNKTFRVSAGESCLAYKNNLARYSKQSENGEFEKVVIVFDEPFLRTFMTHRNIKEKKGTAKEVFHIIETPTVIETFIHSLLPYYDEPGQIEGAFEEIKRVELLLLLLKSNPELEQIFFNFCKPDKIDLKEFMLHNFRFNTGIERFAYMTGRSHAAFKRDFKAIFDMSPGKWLVKRRLEEAFFLISKQGKRASDIYLDLGFEDLSHFSFALKKQFGKNPSEVAV